MATAQIALEKLVDALEAVSGPRQDELMAKAYIDFAELTDHEKWMLFLAVAIVYKNTADPDARAWINILAAAGDSATTWRSNS